MRDKYPIENEVKVDSYEQAILILKTLGCKKKYYVEKIRETWVLSGCKEIVIDSYPGLAEYIEVDCHDYKNLDRVVKKLGLDSEENNVDSDPTEFFVQYMYWEQYGISMKRKATGDLTFKNGKKIFEKHIQKRKTVFNKIIKEQNKYYL